MRNYLVQQSGQACTNNGEDVIVQMNPGVNPDNPFVAATGCDDTWDSPAPCCVRFFSAAAWGQPWTLGFPSPAANLYDMWSTMTHELGHVLCLPHSNDDDDGAECAEEDDLNQDNTMFSSAQLTTTRRFLKPLDVCRLQVSQGDRVNHVVGHRYDTDGVEMTSTHPGFSFLGDPQDGLGLDVDFMTYFAAFSDLDNGDSVELAIDQGGVDWGDPGVGVGGSHSIQVPAIAVGGGRVVVAYLYGQTHDSYGAHAWAGTGKTIWIKWSANDGASWSDAIWIGTSNSGPALAYRGSGCFVIAYATDSATTPDALRTKVSCDYGQTWGNTNTETTRITDRPALAWGSNASWGGITWTTNVLDTGVATANHLRHGRVNYVGGIADVLPTGAGALYYTSNYPALMVSDSGAPQANRYVRIHRSSIDGAAPSLGRVLLRTYSDDLTGANWNGYGSTGAYSRSPPGAGYSTFYDEFWTMFTQ